MSIPAIDSIGKLLVFLGIAIIVIASYFTYNRYQFLEEKAINLINTQTLYIQQLKSNTSRIADLNSQLSKLIVKEQYF